MDFFVESFLLQLDSAYTVFYAIQFWGFTTPLFWTLFKVPTGQSLLVMGVFFIDWELWQEMTFVLACCIVLVFLAGLIKLWSTNRSLRRLEIIDEEKRARVSEMSHCGLDVYHQPPEIPFGVRAIQNGVEVDGIWISRSSMPDDNQIASSAAFHKKYADTVKVKERLTKVNSATRSSQLRPISDSTTSHKPLLFSLPRTPTNRPSKRSAQQMMEKPSRLDARLKQCTAHIPKSGLIQSHPSFLSVVSSLPDPFVTPEGTSTLSSTIRYSSQSSSEPNFRSAKSIRPREVDVVVNRNTKRERRRYEKGPAEHRLDLVNKTTNDEQSRSKPRVLHREITASNNQKSHQDKQRKSAGSQGRRSLTEYVSSTNRI